MATMDVIIALAKTFIIILPGFILGKMNILNKQHAEGMAGLVTTVSYPCLVIMAMQMKFSMETLSNCKSVVIIFVGVTLVAIGIAFALTKIIKMPKSKSGIFAFMLVFGNTGFIGLPVLNGLFGSEAVLYGALCDSVMDVFMFSIGIVLITSSSPDGDNMTPKEIIKEIFNPCLIAVIIGFILYVCQITIPPILAGPMQTVGGVTSPLAMIMVGIHLSSIDLKDMLTDKYAYSFSFFKLLIIPIVALAFVKLVVGSASLLGTTIIVETAMPAAMLSVVLSVRYKADAEFATKGVMLSTLLSLLTIPIYAVISTHM